MEPKRPVHRALAARVWRWPGRVSLRSVLLLAVVVQVGGALLLAQGVMGRQGRDRAERLMLQGDREALGRLTAETGRYLDLPLSMAMPLKGALRSGALAAQDEGAVAQQLIRQMDRFPTAAWIAIADESKNLTAVERSAATPGAADSLQLLRGDRAAERLDRYDLDGQGQRRSTEAPPTSFDLDRETWYRSAVLAGQATWTVDPGNAGGQGATLVLAEPIYDGRGKRLGVLAAAVPLEALTGRWRDLLPEGGASAFVIDRAGQLIAQTRPDKTPELAPNVPTPGVEDTLPVPPAAVPSGADAPTPAPASVVALTSDRPEVRRAAEILQRTYGSWERAIETLSRSTYHRDRQFRFTAIALREPQQVDWLLVATFPNPASGAPNGLIFLTIGGLVLTSAAISWGLLRWITTPIQACTRATHAIAKGQSDLPFEPTGIAEVDELIRAVRLLLNDTQNTLNAAERARNDLATRVKDSTTELSRSESKFSKIFRASPSGIYVQRLIDGAIVDYNDSFLDIFGYSSEEMLGFSNMEFNIWLHAEDRAVVMQTLRRGGSVRNQEIQARTKSREVRTLLLSAEAVYINGAECALFVLNDISDHKRLEEELRLSQQRIEHMERQRQFALLELSRDELHSTLTKMETILGSVQDALVWTDDAGLVQWCNPAFESLVGRDRATILGSPLIDNLPLYRQGQAVPVALHPATRGMQGSTGKAAYEFHLPDRLGPGTPHGHHPSGNHSNHGHPPHLTALDPAKGRPLDGNGHAPTPSGPHAPYEGDGTEERLSLEISWAGVALAPTPTDPPNGTAATATTTAAAAALKLAERHRDAFPTPASAVLIVRDISERKQLIGEVLRAKRFVDGIVEHIPLAVYVKDANRDFQIVLWNRACETTFGIARDRAIGKSAEDLYPIDRAQIVLNRDVEAVESRRAIEIPAETIQSPNGPRILRTIEVPLFDPQGEVAYLLCIADDITDREQAEMELRESQAQFRLLADQAGGDLMFVHDVRGKILDVNQQACRILGYKREELLALNVHNIDTQASLDQHDRIWAMMHPGEPVTLEGMYRCRNGRTFPVETRVGVRLSGGQRVFLATARDVTDRKAMEDKLLQAEEKYRSIVENAVEGIYQCAPNGQFLSGNRALARMFGYDSIEACLGPTGLNRTRRFYVDPDRWNSFLTLIAEHGAVFNFVSKVHARDGRQFWISENARAVKDVDGHLLYYEGTMQNITERKLAEDALVAEQAKADRLLLNILPAPVAERLKQGEQSLADQYANVTILFADLVGFTPVSASMRPIDLVNVLNRIFSEFDRLAEVHGLEKIKTVGDEYMAVGGLPLPKPDHAEAVANMALDMIEVVGKLQRPDGKPFQLRVGIHSGSVVAGVIGIKKFAYDLWGDTVNVASRMESQGEPDRIQVTETVHELLRDHFHFEARGVVEIKGRGDMPTYWLTGRRSP